MATAPSKGGAVAGSFEFPRELEERIHAGLLVDARRAQRARFRPGIVAPTGPAAATAGGSMMPTVARDVLLGERTKKRLGRALTVLEDEYGVPPAMAHEALAYANTWEDALRFLGLQWAGDELPAKLRATPVGDTGTAAGGDDDAVSLDVVRPTPLSAQPLATPAEDWEDERTREMAAVEEERRGADGRREEGKGGEDEELPVTPSEDPTPSTAPDAHEPPADASEALSWTQRYLLQLAEEEARAHAQEAAEAALSPAERELRDLEVEFTRLEVLLRQGKGEGKLSKKKHKALCHELQGLRMRLITLGWREDEYHRRRRGPEVTAVQAEEKEAEAEAGESHVTKSDGRRDDDDEDGNEDYGGGLFDTPPSPSPPAPTPPPSADTTDGVVSRSGALGLSILADFPAALGSWTGKTPRDLLQDHCRKAKLPRPQYKKLSPTRGVHLYALTVELPGDKKSRREFRAPEELFPVAHGFRTIDEAKDTVATMALYALTPHLPLYGMMPPPFRALWLHWEAEKKAAADAIRKTTKQELDDLLENLLVQLPEEIASKVATVEDRELDRHTQHVTQHKDVEGGQTTSTEAPPVLDDWDVDDWDADLSDDEPASGSTVMATATSPVPDHSANLTTEPRVVERPGDRERSRVLRGLYEGNVRTRRHQELLPRRRELPIASFKDQLIASLAAHDIVLVSGETGCGKSTQVPQYLLEEMLVARNSGARCQIVCTQPRRLAAMSLAERVSHELGEETMGRGDSLCGYQIRLENRMTANTCLMFCTTGILLRRLQESSTLESDLSHIIVDEVHERDVQSDVLLSMLRTFLASGNALRHQRGVPPLKVILMSATLNASSFQHYFGGAGKCPMLQVPGRTFPVSEFYLEDAIETTKYVVEEDSPCYRHYDTDGNDQSAIVRVSGRGGNVYNQRVTWSSSTGGRNRPISTTADGGEECPYSRQTLQTLDRLDESVINFELIDLLIEQLVADSPALNLDTAATKSASILIFLPGLQEISNLLDVLASNRVLRDRGSSVELLPLHSSLAPEDQRKIFNMRPGVLRIIATTNIAETSLTIEDVKVVLDTGRAKEMRHDSATRTNLLDEIWIARANAKQRMGRAGRTSGGICYRLFSRDTFRHVMPEQPLPEIKRAPLTSLCLQIKTFGVDASCAEFLDSCLDPPDKESVGDALRELFEIGALEVSQDEHGSKETLTALGMHLARLPVDVKVGKLLLLGAIFDEFDAISTCAAILESKSPFVAPYGYHKDMQAARQKFAVACSDLLTDVNAFNMWRALTQELPNKSNRRRQDEERQFCTQNYLSRRALSEITKLKKQFAGLVVQLGFLHHHDSSYKPLTPSTCPTVAALLYGAMEPNVMCMDPALSNPHRIGLRDGDKTAATAFIHPSSINSKRAEAIKTFPSPFLTYSVKLHTSQVYLASSQMVTPSALCLFSFAMEIVFPHHATDSGQVSIRLNDWITLQSSLRSASLLLCVRDLVRDAIQASIEHPPFASKRAPRPVQLDDLLRDVRDIFYLEAEALDPKHNLTKQLDASK